MSDVPGRFVLIWGQSPMTATALQVVEKIIKSGFHGSIPSARFDVAFATVCILFFAQGANVLVQEQFAFEILAALHVLRAIKFQRVN